MKYHIRNMLFIVLGLTLITAFQNCGKQVEFSSPEQSALVAAAVTSGDVLGDDPQSNPSSDPVKTPPPPPSASNGSDDDDDNDDSHQGSKCNHGKDDDLSNGAEIYVCILAGPGKSTRVAYLDQQLESTGSVPSDVCMSKNACLHLIAKKFEVIGAEYRGFCKKPSHQTVVLSDIQISSLVSK